MTSTHFDTIEVFGTINCSALPSFEHAQQVGAPRVNVNLIAKSDKQRFSSCSLQTFGSPIPFQLFVPREILQNPRALTLEATCNPYTGDDAISACAKLNVTSAGSNANGPFNLTLTPTSSLPKRNQALKLLSPDIHTLSGSVCIPANCQHIDATLLVGLYVIQEDGESNNYSSNIADYAASANQPTVDFAIHFDSNVLPSASALELSINVYDHQQKCVLAGISIPYADLSSPPPLTHVQLEPWDTAE